MKNIFKMSAHLKSYIKQRHLFFCLHHTMLANSYQMRHHFVPSEKINICQ